MKATLIKITTTIFFFLAFFANQANAQAKPYEDPKYGVDSASRMECLMNISLYTEFYKQKNYNDAIGPWRKVFYNCPQASKNTYIKGANIYKNLIVREKDAAEREKLVDSLMTVYDRRVEYYGQKGRVYSYKGVDLYSFRKEEAAQEVYDMLQEACTLEGKKTKAAVVTIFMQAAIDLYRSDAIDGTEVINAYTLSMNTLDKAKQYAQQKNDKDDLEKIATSYDNVEALFSESGAANCEALISIFGPKFDENKADLDWLKKVTALLNKTDCNDSELFAKASEEQYKLEPSAEAAHNLARLFLKSEEYDKAEKYYEEATSLQEDPEKKSLYYFEWSTLAMAQGKYQKVRDLSYKALKFNDKDGRPYLMIGKAYAADSKNIGKEKVEQNAVYWAAVDKFYQAKKVDSTIAEEAKNLINTYSKYFPNKEEAFFLDIQEGKPYTVGGWINETTTARF